MELIFLNRRNLAVLDFGYVNDDYTLVIDSVIPQKSSFTVNKKGINAKVGDIVTIKDKTVNFIGIISSIEENKSKYTTIVQAYDFISILDVDVKVSSYTGDIGLFVCNLINDVYKNTTDSNQKIEYLNLYRDNVSITDTLEFEDDSITTISALLKSFNKVYKIELAYNLNYSKGKIAGIDLHIKQAESGLVLRSDFKGISDLVVIDTSAQVTNKLTFIPSDANVNHRDTVYYYLLTDGTITTDSTSNLRFNIVKNEIIIYYDDDYSTIQTQAQTKLLETSLDHSITFNYVCDNEIAKPFFDFNVGDYIRFITPTKVYQTLITKMQFKNNLNSVSITLGEYRIALTEQIILLRNSRR